VLLLLALIFISLLRNPDLKFWIFGSEWNFVLQAADPRKAVFGLLVILLIRDHDRILRNSYYSAILMLIYMTYQIFLFELFGNWAHYFSLEEGASKYNMSLGYEMIFAALVLLTIAFARKSLLCLLLAGFASGISIYYGARGVVILILAYAGLMLLYWSGKTWKLNRDSFKSKLRTLKTVGIFLIIVVITIAFIVPMTQLLVKQLQPLVKETEMLDEFGEPIQVEDFESRTIESIIDGEFLTDTGRQKIWSLALDGFLDSPVIGQGFYGDRLFVGIRFNWGYSHNILFELMCQFGIFGILALAAFLFFTMKLLSKNHGSVQNLVMIIFGSMCIKLLISDSYLIYNHFWIFLGLLFIGTNLYSRINKKVRLGLVLSLLIISIVSAGAFVYQDSGRQEFKTIEFSAPKLLFTTERSVDSTELVQKIMNEHGFTGVSFLNAGVMDPEEETDPPKNQTDNENKLTYLDEEAILRMKAAGWYFEDGGYRYLNPHIRMPEVQEEFRQSTIAKFAELSLPQAVAYSPPFNKNNSVIKYRSMDDYGFIQSRSSVRQTKPYKTISYPQAMELRAVNFRFYDEENREDFIKYLEKAKNDNALAVVVLSSANWDIGSLTHFAKTAKNMGFESISYQELYELGYESGETLDTRNYFENTYIAQVVRKIIG
ncbi:MAG: O-antigen ligase family protein, partial [Clostridiaceae bacterium]|nr:O-antigen ligase family protein [Clostridiaceae bacterium]